jgi:replicative DNA helicase
MQCLLFIERGLNMLSDLPAERAVLGGLFEYGEDCYLDVADFLQPTTFTDETNQALYKCFEHLFKSESTELDQASLMGAASEIGVSHIFTQPNEAQYIRSVCNTYIDRSNVARWAGKIRKLEVARLLQQQLLAANDSISEITGSEPIEQILAMAEDVVFDFTSLLQDGDNEPIDVADDIDGYLEHLEENPSPNIGISSGMPYYDKAIGGGFRRKTVSLIGARPKTGKTMVALNFALHAAMTLEIPVLFLDTEMTLEDQRSRMLSNGTWHLDPEPAKRTAQTIDQIETGMYSKTEFGYKIVHKAANKLKEIEGRFKHINVSGKTFEELIAIMRRWAMKDVGVDENGNTNDCLIIYDYLKLMSGEGVSESLREHQLLGFMTTTLHNFTVRHDLPVCAFIQLNRDGIDNEHSAAFAQSDRILWLVTNYSIFKKKNDVDRAETGPQNGNRKLIPLDARHGSGMDQDDYINVHMDGAYGVIKEGKTRKELMDDRPREVDDDDIENINDL